MFRGQKTFKFKCLTTQTKSYFLLQNLLQWTGKEHPDCSLLLGTERALRSVLCRCHVILEEDVRWEEEEEEEEAEQRSEHHHEKHLQKHLKSQIHCERLCFCLPSAARTRWSWPLDLLQTVAGGTNTPEESVSRGPTLQLRGECRPLLAPDDGTENVGVQKCLTS